MAIGRGANGPTAIGGPFAISFGHPIEVNRAHPDFVALNSPAYGIGEYTSHMRERLAKLSVDDVNAAIRKHIKPGDFKVVMITKDADDLKKKLESNMPSVMKYEAEKPQELLDEDKVIGAMKLNVTKVEITPVEEIFAK